MNLDLVPLGWLHFAASAAALVVGLMMLVGPKGTAVHKSRGRVYVLSILVTSLTAFGIYRLGRFYFPHWFAVASLVVTSIGLAAARFKRPRRAWRHLHLTAMLASVYILIGGGVNEAFLRVNALHRLIADFNSPVIGMTHLAVMLLFVVLIGYFNALLLLRRRALAA